MMSGMLVAMALVFASALPAATIRTLIPHWKDFLDRIHRGFVAASFLFMYASGQTTDIPTILFVEFLVIIALSNLVGYAVSGAIYVLRSGGIPENHPMISRPESEDYLFFDRMMFDWSREGLRLKIGHVLPYLAGAAIGALCWAVWRFGTFYSGGVIYLLCLVGLYLWITFFPSGWSIVGRVYHLSFDPIPVETEEVPPEVRWTSEYRSPAIRQFTRTSARAYLLGFAIMNAVMIASFFYNPLH